MTELDRITKIYGDGICRLSLNNVAWIQAPLEKEQIFDDDLVHFTIESGTFFIENLMSKASEFFDNTLVDINDVDMEVTNTDEQTREVEVVGEDGMLAMAMRKIKDNELTDLLKAMMAPVRTYGYVFAYSEGSQKSIKGNFHFFEMDVN